MEQRRYRVLDMHTAGEPVRIVTDGYPKLQGNTILEKRRDARERLDHIRKTLMLEPRGHSGMYGVIPTEPCDPTADLAVLFMHNEGYSTMCGHATIAVARWAVESGRVVQNEPKSRFRLEVPCGVVEVEATVAGGRVTRGGFESVPSFASRLDQRLHVPGLGDVKFDIAFGGAYYAILPASSVGLPFFETPLAKLIDAGVRITEAVRGAVPIAHPSEPDLGFLYGTILIDDAGMDEASYNLCVFAEGQIDRSPTGSGATARMALDHARGRIGAGTTREIRGVSGAGFLACISNIEGERVRVRVEGESYVTGEAEFVVESGDPLGAGFELPADFGRVRR